MARKPFNTSVAENVLTHGTGGINIDECRIKGENLGIKKKKQEVNLVKIQIGIIIKILIRFMMGHKEDFLQT